MKPLLKLFGALVLMVALMTLYACVAYRPEPFSAGTVSEARLGDGPWTVASFEETFVDRTRPTQANRDYEGSPERVMEGDVWYPQEKEAGPAPLLVFSHGFTSLRSNGDYLAEHLASHGFVVIGVDYPLTNLSAPGGPMLEDVVNQPGDVSFLIDTLLAYNDDADHPLSGRIDAERMGVFGISLGGLTSTLVGYHPDWRDPRVGAVLSIAGPTHFFEPLFFTHADIPLLMLAGDLDVIVPWATNAVPIPDKLPGATLVTIHGGSHTGFSGGTSWLRWMRNTDALGCYSVMRYIKDDPEAGWNGLLGDGAQGIDYAAKNQLCQVSPLPKTMNVLRQQMISKVAIRAFFESTLSRDTAVRAEAQAYLSDALATELEDVDLVRSVPARGVEVPEGAPATAGPASGAG